MREEHEFRIVITPFCNYHCFFCHSEGLTRESTPLLLTPEDYEFVVCYGKALFGWNTVTVTGGEPLLSPIYRQTCELIAGQGIRITTVTNGSLLASPKKMLKDNCQVNISLHALDQAGYELITGTQYPIESVVNTIMSVRAQLPTIAIHINSTIVRGINDEPRQMEQLIELASMVGGVAKFIDLASNDRSLVVPCEEIVKCLELLGFETVDRNEWQCIMARDGQRSIVTRCGFASENVRRGYRNLFINPDGTLFSDEHNGVTIDVLKEIKERDVHNFAKKVVCYFPPAAEH